MNQYEMQRAMLNEMRRREQEQLMQQLASQQTAPQMPAPQMNIPAPQPQMPTPQASGFNFTPEQGIAAMTALRSAPMQVPQMNVSGPNIIPISPVDLGDSGGDIMGMISSLQKGGAGGSSGPNLDEDSFGAIGGLLDLISKVKGIF